MPLRPPPSGGLKYVESGAFILYGFWQWLSYVPMACVQGALLGGGHSVNQLAAVPALTTCTPSTSNLPTLGDKATGKDGHGNMLVLVTSY